MARTDYGAILSTVIKDTSDAIREVNGTSNLIAPNQWGTAIRTMHSDSDYENALEQMIEETATGDIASFSDGANDIPLKSLACTINPVQSGSGDPSPSNVRPITGYTELNLVHTGANIWDEEWESGSIIPSTGEDVANANKIRSVGRIAVKPNTSYVIVFSGVTSGSDYIYYYKKDGTFISSESYIHTVNGTQVFTTPSDCYGLRFIMSQTAYNNNISVNYPSTDTSYHAYNGTSTTITFPDTVYGASLNVGSGLLTNNVDIGTLSTTDTWAYSSSLSTSNTNVFYTLGSHPEISFNSLDELSIVNCDYMPTGSRNDVFNSDTNMIGMSGGLTTGAITVRIDKTICADLTAFQQFITDHTVTYAYKKATPTTTQLTPQEVKSLLGSNNFYHDCNGQVAVTYRANGQLYVEQHS